jgi:TIR domain
MSLWRGVLGGAALCIALLCAVLGASVFAWLQAALTAVLMCAVLAVSWRGFGARKWVWPATAVLASVAALLLFYEDRVTQQVCTATDASGKLQVIGTELTDFGKKYAAQNPTDGKNEILQSLAGLEPSTAWTAESIRACQFHLLAAGLWLPMLGIALACVAAMLSAWITGSAAAPERGNKVFVSYNHEDASVALRVRQALARRGLQVSIDVAEMAAGERIQEFIERSLKDSDVVVSIVSARSLLSSWVAVETINAFHRQKWVAGKLLLGALLDDELFRPEFRLECTRSIDDRLERLEKLIEEYRAQKIDPVDLNDEKTRLFDLRNNMGGILAHLKGMLCVDLREPHFEESCAKLTEAVKRRP